jgi:hypothetical protein
MKKNHFKPRKGRPYCGPLFIGKYTGNYINGPVTGFMWEVDTEQGQVMVAGEAPEYYNLGLENHCLGCEKQTYRCHEEE